MYEVKITETSRELTKKERVAIKNTTGAIRLDAVAPEPGEGEFCLVPDFYCLLEVHNDRATSENKDYTQLIIVDTEGTVFLTGSNSFIESFVGIWEEMEGQDYNDPFTICVSKQPSKNRTGKYFLTCNIVM